MICYSARAKYLNLCILEKTDVVGLAVTTYHHARYTVFICVNVFATEARLTADNPLLWLSAGL